MRIEITIDGCELDGAFQRLADAGLVLDGEGEEGLQHARVVADAEILADFGRLDEPLQDVQHQVDDRLVGAERVGRAGNHVAHAGFHEVEKQLG